MSAPDAGLLAAVLLAGGVTAVVAIVMVAVRQYRAAQLTATRGALSVTLGVAVVALAGLGIVALSPVAAQASTSTVSTTTVSSTTSVSSSTVTDVQLPTLAYNG